MTKEESYRRYRYEKIEWDNQKRKKKEPNKLTKNQFVAMVLRDKGLAST